MEIFFALQCEGFFICIPITLQLRRFRYAIKQKELPMMHFQLAGSGVMSAFYPHESELSRRVKQLIRAAKKQLEALCAMK
ncbi:hypothetical protein CI736_17340 [Shigella boydii]|nr:hypothetical protein CI736_17340 [Shigella boydii]OYJ46143.1 hypothetical protein CI737_03105 [Escherichia coli]